MHDHFNALQPAAPFSSHTNEATEAATARRPNPWPWFVLLLTVSLLTDHRYDFSTQENLDGDAEAFQAGVEQGSSLRRATYGLLGVVGLIGILRGRRRLLRFSSPLAIILISALIWSFTSLLWSTDPMLTLRRLFLLATVVLAVATLTITFDVDRIPQYALFYGGTLALVGLLCEIVLGTFHPFSGEYRFSGTVHPNYQSVNVGLAALACFCLLLQPATRRRWLWAIAPAALAAMLLTKSRTPLYAGAASICLFCFTVGPRRRAAIAATAFLWLGGWLFLLGGQDLLAAGERGVMLGRESEDVKDLTGRLPLWLNCLEYAAERPLTGYGYQTFWDVDHIGQIAARQGWSIKEAHNAYLQVTLDLGVPGLALFSAGMALGAIVAYSRYRREPNAGHAFCCIILVFGLLQSITESGMVDLPTAYVVVCTWCLAFLAFRSPTGRTDAAVRKQTSHSSAAFIASEIATRPNRPILPAASSNGC